MTTEGARLSWTRKRSGYREETGTVHTVKTTQQNHQQPQQTLTTPHHVPDLPLATQPLPARSPLKVVHALAKEWSRHPPQNTSHTHQTARKRNPEGNDQRSHSPMAAKQSATSNARREPSYGTNPEKHRPEVVDYPPLNQPMIQLARLVVVLSLRSLYSQSVAGVNGGKVSEHRGCRRS